MPSQRPAERRLQGSTANDPPRSPPPRCLRRRVCRVSVRGMVVGRLFTGVAEMSVRREYKCNLCHSPIVETGSGNVGGVGIHFAHPHLQFKLVNDTENHLCSRCLEGIKEELASQDRRYCSGPHAGEPS